MTDTAETPEDAARRFAREVLDLREQLAEQSRQRAEAVADLERQLAETLASYRGEVERVTAERDEYKRRLLKITTEVAATAARWTEAAAADARTAAMVRDNGDHQDTAEGHDIRADMHARHAEVLREALARTPQPDAADSRPVTIEVHRWYAIVREHGEFYAGVAATQDGIRVHRDQADFERDRDGGFEI